MIFADGVGTSLFECSARSEGVLVAQFVGRRS